MDHRLRVRVAGAALALLAAGAAAPSAPRDPVRAAIARHVASLRSAGAASVLGEPLSSATVLPRLYARRDHAPAWSDPAAAASLLGFLRALDTHGLDPRHYHLAALEALTDPDADGAQDPARRAARDLLLSDALVRVAGHLAFGKVDRDALVSRWDLARELDPDAADLAAEIQRTIDAPDVAAALEARAPASPLYAAARRALARYRAVARAGGWPRVPPGPTLEAGAEGPRVRALRRRLAASGDRAAGGTHASRFDAGLRRAVERFQRRHALRADGVVGRETLAALNAPAWEQADRIRVNLERARWVLRDLGAEFLLVDIASFTARLHRDATGVWESRVAVGCPSRPTPVFRDVLEYVELNPVWVLPPVILEHDVLPRVREDPGYLERHGMRVLAPGGAAVDPRGIDWSRFTAGDLPYRIVQAPGPANPLGRVKFGFPNPHLVYLHDTPDRALFESADRARSSGCIRVEDPFGLAEILLDDPGRWSREQLRAAAASGETRRIELPRPIPIVLLYWTIDLEDPGSVRFVPDLYERDPPVLVALRDAFRGTRPRAAAEGDARRPAAAGASR